MIDVLERLDAELDRTPHDAYICRPLPRTVVAAAAAEIRRLRAAISLQERLTAIVMALPDDSSDQPQP